MKRMSPARLREVTDELLVELARTDDERSQKQKVEAFLHHFAYDIRTDILDEIKDALMDKYVGTIGEYI